MIYIIIMIFIPNGLIWGKKKEIDVYEILIMITLTFIDTCMS